MADPRNFLKGVYLTADFDARELFKGSSLSLEFAQENAHHQDDSFFMFFVGGDAKSFLSDIGDHSHSGCPQEMIEYLKYARHLGAKWAMFYV